MPSNAELLEELEVLNNLVDLGETVTITVYKHKGPRVGFGGWYWENEEAANTIREFIIYLAQARAESINNTLGQIPSGN